MLRYIGAFLLDLLYPPKCFGCGVPVKPGKMFCGRCREPILRREELCWRCGKTKTRCGCTQRTPAYREGIALYPYRDGMRRSIQAFKYDGAKDMGRLFGRRLGDACLARWGSDLPFDGVTYVPMHPRKLAARGYQPTRLLAEHCGAVLGLPLIEGCICHTGNRHAQATCDTARKRRENAKKSFVSAPKAPDIRGRRLLLIDDVLTTGSTVNRCAELLVRQGAQVYVGAVCTGMDEEPMKHRRTYAAQDVSIQEKTSSWRR